MLDAAIIGLGWWGQRLVQAAHGSGLIRFRRGVTLEPEQAREFAAANGMSLGTSFDEVLADPAIHAVVLATPHTRHRAQVEAAARAGKHVYCEKPFALAKADAQAMLEACARAGVTIGVGHHFRLMPSMKALRREVASGALGTIMHAEANYSHDWLASMPADNWRAAPQETRAGGMTGMGIHLLDCLRDAIGPMRRLCALSKRRALPFAWRLAVYGENAWVESASETRLIVRRAGGEPQVTDFAPANHLGENLEAFAAAALGRGTFPIDAAGILHTVAALDAVFRSADADGAWQQV
jgi:predicted dehydrogenase